MPNLTIKGWDGRELQISLGNFVYFKDNEEDVNWEWEYRVTVAQRPHRIAGKTLHL